MLSFAAKNSNSPRSNGNPKGQLSKEQVSQLMEDWGAFDVAEMKKSQGPTSRFELLNPTIEKPEKNAQETERLQKLSRINALGQMFGGLAQLGGMASGGDAVNLGNQLGDFSFNRFMQLDRDYINQLRDYNSQLFQAELFNKRLNNENAAYDRGRQANEEDWRRRQEAEENAYKRQIDFENQKFDRNQSQDLRRRMQGMGIDPDSPNAYSDFVAKSGQEWDLNKKNTNSLIEARGGSGGGKSNASEQTLQYFQAGYNEAMSKIDEQLKNPELIGSQRKALEERKAQLQKLKYDQNSGYARQLTQRGYELSVEPNESSTTQDDRFVEAQTSFDQMKSDGVSSFQQIPQETLTGLVRGLREKGLSDEEIANFIGSQFNTEPNKTAQEQQASPQSQGVAQKMSNTSEIKGFGDREREVLRGFLNDVDFKGNATDLENITDQELLMLANKYVDPNDSGAFSGSGTINRLLKKFKSYLNQDLSAAK